LSVRETEVAILAGSQTNIEISARLAISLRTVENHISRALKKTGMTTRQALYRYVQGSIRE
jgi:DNA-binding CsgD family transcriptional regulator